jgi:glucose-1-phosphate adenylyltransferase
MPKNTKSEAELADKVTAVVLAGGQGTRLFPLTLTRCKPAVSFGGRYRLIDVPLSNSLHSKINRIFVISQYFASHLNQHIAATYHGDFFPNGSIELLCPEETAEKKVWFEGTADAVRKNLDHLLKTPADYFLILSGDQLYSMDFKKMLEFAMAKDADLVIASLPVEEAEARRMGLLKLDHTMQVAQFVEKPNDPKVLEALELPQSVAKDERKYLGSMGIYIFKRAALIDLLKERGEDFGRHLIPTQVSKGKTYAFVFDGYWEDIGTIASYYHANLALIDHKHCLEIYDESKPIYTRPQNLASPLIKKTLIKDSLISQGAIIEAEEITHSLIGVRAHLKRGSVIRDSIIVGHEWYAPQKHQSPPLPSQFIIGENCHIEKAIIDEHTYIGNNVQLTNKKGLKTFDSDGIYIRDGIIIVTTGTHIPDNYVL